MSGELFGTAIQHALQKEFEEIAQYARNSQTTIYRESMQALLPQAVQLGMQANRAGFIVKASQIADFCFAIIDGIKQGIEATLDTVTHPVEFLHNTINSMVTIVRCV